jgi:hypothetical protein
MLSVTTVNLSDQDQMLVGGKSLNHCKPVASVVLVKDSATETPSTSGSVSIQNALCPELAQT